MLQSRDLSSAMTSLDEVVRRARGGSYILHSPFCMVMSRQTVTVVPSNFVSEKPSKGSLYVSR